MAIFRDGVKVGKFDIRAGLTKQRGQGILRKLGVLESPPKAKRPGGEVDAIRTVVGMGEGFMMPVNYKVVFNAPQGIIQPKGPDYNPTNTQGSGKTIKGGSLDWQTHKLQRSTQKELMDLYNQANPSARTTYRPFQYSKEVGLLGKFLGESEGSGTGEGGGERMVRKMDLYCSKVSIPDKTINVGLYRHYGEPYPFPQSIQYGTITTTFYCDATMSIKKYFDAWQKLIVNDMTGNFNYMDEYQSSFNVFTRSTIQRKQVSTASEPATRSGNDAPSFPENISSMIKNATAKFNELTGVPNPPEANAETDGKVPAVAFSQTYGVKVFNCWPQVVGAIDLSHDATDQIGTFDVTWAYTKWSPFAIGPLGRKGSEINLSVGEFRNEKDGFPFLEDLPPELGGPLTGALNQAVTTGPLSNLSNLVG